MVLNCTVLRSKAKHQKLNSKPYRESLYFSFNSWSYNFKKYEIWITSTVMKHIMWKVVVINLKTKTFNIRISQCLDSMVRMSVLFTNRDIARWKYYIQLSGIEQKNSCCQIYNNIMRHILRIMQEIRYHIDLHNAYVAYTTVIWM